MAHIEAADRALIVIGAQHLLAKMRVALFTDLLQIKSHLFSQFFLNTLREMRLEDLMGEGIVGRLFWDFDGKPITLPQGKECYPQEGFVAWHRREVFRG